MTVRLPVSDLGSLPLPNRKTEALRLVAEEAQRPFELTLLPLLRARLLRITGAEHLFVLNVHHIIFDGWSLTVFFRELASIYERLRAGKPADLPELPIQYADFAVWQQGRLKLLERDLAWWKRHLSGPLPILEL